MRVFTKDDGLLGSLHKIATITALIFGVWAYFHTVHPVFQKENDLQLSIAEIERLKEEGISISSEIEEREIRLKKLNSQLLLEKEKLEQTQMYAERKAEESRLLEIKIGALSKNLANTRKESVRAIISGVLDDISKVHLDSYIAEKYHGKKSVFDLKAHTIKVANERIEKSKEGGVEYAAYSVLKLFAEEKIASNVDDYRPIFDVIVFSQFNEKALRLIGASEDEA